MWEPGNSVSFLKLVNDLTDKPLEGDDWVNQLKQELDHVITSEKEAYETAGAALDAGTAAGTAGDTSGDDDGDGDGEIDLDMRIRIVDGDDIIADTTEDGGFLKTCNKFEQYIVDRYRK
mmetsp:Transcript_94992/g.271615  ORF Transcript_94992/g.271615 Transcript_94992/m.271615 type:complete len:119 (-) Transcript_94992:136-492(-)